MKRLHCNYAASMSHGFDIHNLFQDNQLENAKNIFSQFTLVGHTYKYYFLIAYHFSLCFVITEIFTVHINLVVVQLSTTYIV